MRILVTGSRTWTDYKAIEDALCRQDDWPSEVTIVHGDCPSGADAIANRIALRVGWTVERHPADWKRYGKRAGYIRNAEMVKLGADVCLAFIKDGSKGATMCAELAEKAGIPTERIPK